LINGSPSWVIGKKLSSIHSYLNKVQPSLDIQINSYRDWTVEEVAGITGLSLAKAETSKEKT